MNNKNEELKYIGQLNAQFVKALRETVEPFVKNFIKIHSAKTENEKDLELLKNCIHLIDVYSLNEAKIVSHFKFVKDKDEKELLNEINHELAIVKEISNDAKKGYLKELYDDCLKLENELIKLEDMISYKEKTAA